MTLKPQLITARTRIGERTFVAFASPLAPFACHPTLLFDDMRGEHTSAIEWSITHLPTGRALSFRFAGMEQCERFMARVAPLCNWNAIHDEIEGHRARRRMHLIMERYYRRVDREQWEASA